MSELEQAARQLQEAEITLEEFISISGKFWYDRFVDELEKKVPWAYTRSHAKKVAERAAGIE